MMMSLKPNFKIKKLTIKQINKFADTVLDWGNLVFAGSFLYQVINQNKIGWLGLLGAIFWVASLVFGLSIL